MKDHGNAPDPERLHSPADLSRDFLYPLPHPLEGGGNSDEILRSIPGVELLEFERHGLNSRCCGAGGAARKVFHENAVAIGRLTINEAVEKKADRLILSCPACYCKVNEAMQGHDRQIVITDIMELIGNLIEGERT